VARTSNTDEIEEELQELDRNINRLRVEYEQYFKGTRREPLPLAGKVQKSITKFASQPPRNTSQKFRLNSVVARYHCFRTSWGRTIRQIEAGTYRPHLFRMGLTEAEAEETPGAKPARQQSVRGKGDSTVEQLCSALVEARTRTGQATTGITTDSIRSLIAKQAKTLREKHGDVRVKFRVVIDGDRAKLKASITKPQ